MLMCDKKFARILFITKVESKGKCNITKND